MGVTESRAVIQSAPHVAVLSQAEANSWVGNKAEKKAWTGTEVIFSWFSVLKLLSGTEQSVHPTIVSKTRATVSLRAMYSLCHWKKWFCKTGRMKQLSARRRLKGDTNCLWSGLRGIYMRPGLANLCHSVHKVWPFHSISGRWAI